MFLVRWVRTLISLPLVWAGRLAAMFKSPASVGFLKAAWAIGGDGEVGQVAMSEILKHAGLEAARAQGEIWLAQRPCPQVATYTGMLASDCGDMPAARTCLARGRDLGDDPSGLLEFLEFVIARRDDRPDAASELAERLSHRTNLSPTVSKMVLDQLLWTSMIRGELGRAREYAERLLQVEADPPASILLWALAEDEGDHNLARKHLADARGFPADQRLYFMCLADLAVGQRDEAVRLAQELREYNDDLADLAENIIDQSEATP